MTDFNYYSLIERESTFPMPSLTIILLCALHFCFSAYYVFSISFPVDFHFVLLFHERYNNVLMFKIISKPLFITVLAYSLNKALSLEIIIIMTFIFYFVSPTIICIILLEFSLFYVSPKHSV